jgi:hypothetical protein
MDTSTEADAFDPLPQRLPPIKLRHREALAVLLELGYGTGVSYPTFYEYMKSLRKLGIPFEFGTTRSHAKARPKYSFDDVMEMATTLSLRIYHVVPDSLLAHIICHRTRLRRFYRKAYLERWTGGGRPIEVSASGSNPIKLHGLFLELGVRFSGGKPIKLVPPRLLSPTEALRVSAQRMHSLEMLLPLNISVLAEHVVDLAMRAAKGSRASEPRSQSGRSRSGTCGRIYLR